MQSSLPPLEAVTFDLPPEIDSTMITSFRSCPYRFLLTYCNHLRGDGSIPLVFGGTFAKGLEVYRRVAYSTNHDHDSALEAAAEAMIMEWGDHPSQFVDLKGQPDKRTLDRCIHSLGLYFQHFPTSTDMLQPHLTDKGSKVSFEFSFAVPLEESHFPKNPATGAPFVYAGRMDTLGTYGRLDVWSDEKTTQRMGATWADQWRMRHQFQGYGWALRHLGFKARHVVVRGIGVNARETRFAETHPIQYHDWLLDKFEQELSDTLWQMVHMWEWSQTEGRSRFPRAFGDACYSYFTPCPFTDHCKSRPSIEMSHLRIMPRNKWSPLRVEQEAA